MVVASALHRMQLYQDAYGFTRLRLFVDVFEGWLGFVVLAVVVAGVVRWGAWLPRFALSPASSALLGLAAINPDAWIAGHNIDRYEATGKLDVVPPVLSPTPAPTTAVTPCLLRPLPGAAPDARPAGAATPLDDLGRADDVASAAGSLGSLARTPSRTSPPSRRLTRFAACRCRRPS